MEQAVLPLLGYLILQVFVLIVGLNIVQSREIGISGVLKSWIFGQILLFAVLQIMAVPMILLKWKFDVLFWSYFCVSIVVFSFGLWRLIKGKTKIRIKMPELKPLEMLLLMIVVLLILWQSCSYFFGIHIDEDDARWLAEANDALEYGNMMTRDWDTGEYLGIIQTPKDATSPWSIMWAIASRLILTKPSIFAHTIFAPIQILIMYGVYWLIAKELFSKSKSKVVFLLFVLLTNIFNTGTVYTQSTFSLVRIWQGKASVAGIIVPLLLYVFIIINGGNKTGDWLKLSLICCSSCLMSGIGITLAAIVILAYGFYNVVMYKNWTRIPLVGMAILPSIVSLLMYSSLKVIR